MKRVYNNILETIGDTPIVKLNNICKEVEADVYVKIESTNPGNSVNQPQVKNLIIFLF